MGGEQRAVFRQVVTQLLDERLARGHFYRKCIEHLNNGNYEFAITSAKRCGVNEKNIRAVLALLLG